MAGTKKGATARLRPDIEFPTEVIVSRPCARGEDMLAESRLVWEQNLSQLLARGEGPVFDVRNGFGNLVLNKGVAMVESGFRNSDYLCNLEVHTLQKVQQ